MSELSELWEMLSGLQISDLIFCVISFLLLDLFAISIILATRRENKLCQKRWQKVSAGLELQQNNKHYSLEADEILLGRHVSADIRLTDSSVSRYHAVMTVTAGVWSITDLEAKSGTYVNGKRVKQKKLAIGDCIQLGNTKLYLAKRPVQVQSKK